MANAYYVERARRPFNCWDCDGLHACRCDAVTIRAAKRGARGVWKQRMAEEALEPPLDYFRELASDRLAMKRLFGTDAWMLD